MESLRVYGTRNLLSLPLVLVVRCVRWYAKHYGGAGISSPCSQCVLAVGAKHRSDAALPGVIVADKVSISALGALEFV